MGNKSSLLEGEYAVYCCSDLHMDWEENLDLIKNHLVQQDPSQEKILICAGDISAYMDTLEDTLKLLKQVYKHVFFTFGNNELRVKKNQKYFDSLVKLEHILGLCKKIGIETEAKQINDVWIVPLHSWYTPYFDPSYKGDETYQKKWLDFYECNFSKIAHEKVGDCLLKMNLESIYKVKKSNCENVITFSHFLPRRDLLPTMVTMYRKNIEFVSGHSGIEEQIRELKSKIHVYGHTHYNGDCVIDGVRYVQNALAHPSERKYSISWGSYEPKLIYKGKMDSEKNQ